MSPTQINDLLALVLGALLPPAISYLKNSQWPPRGRFLLSLLVCVLVGVVQVAVGRLALGQPLTVQAMLVQSGLIFSASQASYKLWFAPTVANADLTKAVVL